jgi:hypothetical protein
MQFRPVVGQRQQRVKPQTRHLFLAKMRLALTFLWAIMSIVLIFATIFEAFKGNIR